LKEYSKRRRIQDKYGHLVGLVESREDLDPYPYKTYDEKKSSVLKRDKYICQWCSVKIGDTVDWPYKHLGHKRQVTKNDFLVHHLDGNKKNQRLNNLITLCQHCHHSYHRKKETIEKAKQPIQLENGRLQCPNCDCRFFSLNDFKRHFKIHENR